MGSGRYGCEEKGAIEGECEDVVKEIEVVLCSFVVRSPVCGQCLICSSEGREAWSRTSKFPGDSYGTYGHSGTRISLSRSTMICRTRPRVSIPMP